MGAGRRGPRASCAVTAASQQACGRRGGSSAGGTGLTGRRCEVGPYPGPLETPQEVRAWGLPWAGGPGSLG